MDILTFIVTILIIAAIVLGIISLIGVTYELGFAAGRERGRANLIAEQQNKK
jgi:Tfp pilus assembly protein PilV